VRVAFWPARQTESLGVVHDNIKDFTSLTWVGWFATIRARACAPCIVGSGLTLGSAQIGTNKSDYADIKICLQGWIGTPRIAAHLRRACRSCHSFAFWPFRPTERHSRAYGCQQYASDRASIRLGRERGGSSGSYPRRIRSICAGRTWSQGGLDSAQNGRIGRAASKVTSVTIGTLIGIGPPANAGSPQCYCSTNNFKLSAERRGPESTIFEMQDDPARNQMMSARV
jgi:hypothetical protein